MNCPELFCELAQWACPIELVQPIAWDIQQTMGKRAAIDFIAQHHSKWNQVKRGHLQVLSFTSSKQI